MLCPSDSTFEQFVAGALAVPEEQQMAEHLDACAACAERVEALCSGELQAAKSASGPASAGARAAASQRPAAAVKRFDEPEGLREQLYRLPLPETVSLEGGLHAGSLQPNEPPSPGPPSPGPPSPGPPSPGPRDAAKLLRLLGAGPTDDVDGVRLGRFIVRRWLGAGGFGVVFLADDERLHRQVALKLPRAQSLSHPESRARFLREAASAAQLQHPNLVPVYEAGEEQGIDYIVSAYCAGPTLDSWLAAQRAPVPTGTALRILSQLAEAVEYAHQHHVLHRDIKPGNILLEPHAADPQTLIPKITDFGLAKRLDHDDSGTRSYGMLGTPHYMAPEQIAGSRAAIGPAADVFALGAVLYELLTGAAPYAGADQAEALERLRDGHPRDLRRQLGEISRDLQAICLKCLQPRPEDRYATAQALADDLRRFAQGEPTQARPPSGIGRLRRRAARQPVGLMLLVVAAAVLLGTQAILFTHRRSLDSYQLEIQTALHETEAVQQALRNQQARSERLQYASRIAMVQQALEEHDLSQAAQLLESASLAAPELAAEFVGRYLRNQVAAEGQVIESSGGSVYDARFTPSGTRLASCGAAGVLRLYEGRSFAPLLSIRAGQGELNGVSFSPDERTVATAGDDGTVRLWNATSGQLQRTIQAHAAYAYRGLFRADGEMLITCGREPVIRLWDPATGACLGELTGHTEEVESLALSPDGTQLASASSDTTIRLWDLHSRGAPRVLTGHQGRVVAVQYSPDGGFLLTGGVAGELRLWRVVDGCCLQIEQHLDPLTSVAFLGQDQLVATDRGGLVQIWSRLAHSRAGSSSSDPARAPASSGTPLHSWQAHQGRGWQVTPAPGREGVITGGSDGRLAYWPAVPRGQHALHLATRQDIPDVAFDREEPRVHYVHRGSGVWSWPIVSERSTRTAPQGVAPPEETQALCSLPGGGLATLGSDGLVRGFVVDSGRLLFCLEPRWHPSPTGELVLLSSSWDGRRLALFSCTRDTTLVYERASEKDTAWQEIAVFEANALAMALSADGARLAMSDSNDLVVWDVDRRHCIAQLQGHTSSAVDLQFSPDARWLASGSNDRTVRLWDLDDPGISWPVGAHRGKVQTVAFSPDGHSLASGDDRGELRFWMLPGGEPLLSMDLPAPVRHLRFSPDGNQLAVHTSNEIRILDGSP